MALNRFLLFLTLFISSLFSVSGQEQEVVLKGKITGPDQMPLPSVNILLKNSRKGTFSDKTGHFLLKIHPGRDSVLIFSILNFKTLERKIPPLSKNEWTVIMTPVSIRLSEVLINQQRKTTPAVVNIDPRLTKNLPNTGGGAVEQLVKTLPGVSSHNELSPQYSVRGGNYDENLLYVNGIEIFRPFLVKTGEQEGLSFLNPDLVGAIRFSSGGFDSSYGDKMSSVLDIDYKTPNKPAGSAELGALSASAHLEGRAYHDKFTWLTGIRYRDNRYLLGTLDQKGRYEPSDLDLQALFGFQFSDQFSLGFLTNFSNNTYNFIPESRETRFGTMSQSYLLKIYFDGKEKDQFTNRMGALTFNYDPSHDLHLQLTGSAFYSDEKERYDILGQYYLNDITSGSSPSGTPDSTQLMGVGSSLQHAGNFLKSNIFNLEHSGKYRMNDHQIHWGFKFQSERIHDQVSEWEMRDSAGYSLPYNNQSIGLYRSIKADNTLNSNRYSGYLQDNFTAHLPQATLSFNVGGRMQYWDYNDQLIFSPRLSLRYAPDGMKQLQFSLAWGVYQQMPFFKELKSQDATLVPKVKAQKSVHYIAGVDHTFSLDNRPFKLTAELWYKSMSHLIPYKTDNLNLQYFPNEQAKGYAAGLEVKLIGEAVPGALSWASITLMKTKEDILGDHYLKQGANGTAATTVYPGYLPRPGDQRFNFNLFFQDFLPKNPTVKMNLTLLYGTGLPFGPPHSERYLDTFRMPSYRRVDLGFSKLLVGNIENKRTNGISRYMKEAWLSLEIFNLFDIDNTISYYWVSDFENQMHAVPNYLTGRRLNLKASVSF